MIRARRLSGWLTESAENAAKIAPEKISPAKTSRVRYPSMSPERRAKILGMPVSAGMSIG
jgi:hypothetical protein